MGGIVLLQWLKLTIKKVIIIIFFTTYLAHLQPNLFKQILEHFFKQDFGPKEKKQLFSDQHFSTQDSILLVVHCGGMVGHLRPVMQTGHIPPSTGVRDTLSPHENNNKIGISRNFLFIRTSISKFRVFVKKKKFL